MHKLKNMFYEWERGVYDWVYATHYETLVEYDNFQNELYLTDIFNIEPAFFIDYQD